VAPAPATTTAVACPRRRQPAELVALCTVAPWTIRNTVVFDTFVPVSTQLGTALAGTYNDAARTDREHPASWRSLRRVPDYQYLVRRWREIPEPLLDTKLRAAGLRYAADRPAYVAGVVLWNTARALDLAGMSWSRHTASTISICPRWADAGVVTFGLFAALAIAGAFMPRGRRTPPHVAAVPHCSSSASRSSRSRRRAIARGSIPSS
jgi:hypothetical protein